MEILIELAKLSPIIAILVVGLIYFYKKEKAYKKEISDNKDKHDEQISELNKELRDNEKDNLQMISKLADSLDKISNVMNTDNKLIRQEISNLKDIIQIKIDSLKDGKR